MGAYLSEPMLEKDSADGSNSYLSYGSSSMQGWRISQEDAHNCVLELMSGCALFAVYDGHGGEEVAQYTAETLPQLLKDSPLLAKGRVRDALRAIFLQYDASLLLPEVVERLKTIAGRDSGQHSDDDEDEKEEVNELFHEAHMPLEELMTRYSGDPPKAGALSRVKAGTNQKPLSPFLRGKSANPFAGSSFASASAASGSPPATTGSMSSKEEDVKADDVGEGDVQKNLIGELADSTKPTTQNGSGKSEGNGSTLGSDTHAESDKPVAEHVVAEVESNGSDHKTIEKKPEIAAEDDQKPADITAGDDQMAVIAAKKSEVKKPLDPKEDESVTGSGDSKSSSDDVTGGDSNGAAEPQVNGDGGAAKRALKGPRPGSDKTPVTPSTAAAAGSPATAAASGGRRKRRQMPARAAAGIYRSVLEGARLASQQGHADPESDQLLQDDEEEEDDEDFDVDNGETVNNDDDDDDDDEASDEEDECDDEGGVEDEDMDGDDTALEEQDGEEDGALEDEEEDSDFMMGMKDEPGSDSGCTAVVALLFGQHLYVANVGDSRCVLSRSGRAVDMSADHKPEDEPERQRIEAAGGRVTMDGRVNGGLNLSRAFGDHAYKNSADLTPEQQMISCDPDIRRCKLQPGDGDQFIVIACDGIWNSMTSQQVVDFVSEWMDKPSDEQIPLSAICEKLFDECMAPDTRGDGTGCDNMTCIIVKLQSAISDVTPPVEPVDDVTPPVELVDDVTDAARTDGEPAANDAVNDTADDASATNRSEDEPPEKRRRVE